MKGGPLSGHVFEIRKNCILTARPTLEHLHTFRNFPVFIGATDSNRDSDLLADMTWDICVETGMIQLRELLDPELVYSGYHSEAIGGVWKQHHDEFCDFSSKFLSGSVVEIGGSNGYVANNLIRRIDSISDYTIIEPNASCKPSEKIKIVQKFFNKETASTITTPVNAILHSHTFEHAYDPIDFMSSIATISSPGSAHIFSVPKLDEYLKSKFTNTLNFEHTYYLTDKVIRYLLARFGFAILETREFKNHSRFYACRFNGEKNDCVLQSEYAGNKEVFSDFVTFYQNSVDKLNREAADFSGDIYLFGGHIFSQFLICIGLNADLVAGILDNSSDKQGKRLYGTNLRISSPEIIQGRGEVGVILKAGQYQDEIREQLTRLNPDVVIWE